MRRIETWQQGPTQVAQPWFGATAWGQGPEAPPQVLRQGQKA